MTIEDCINKIEMYRNGILRDNGERDKVHMQAHSMQFYIDQLKKQLTSNTIGVSYSVNKISTETKEEVCLYEYIETIIEAVLLAQLAMYEKKNQNEIIYILPGWNVGLKETYPEQYNRALQLAEKYKSERELTTC